MTPTRRILPALALLGTLAASSVSAETPHDRSLEVVDYDCRTDIGQRRVTLFGNGTVRVWTGLERGLESDEELEMQLGELSPEEREGYLNRLAQVDLSEANSFAAPSARGEWVNRCRFRLDLEGDGVDRIWEWGEFDSLPMSLATLKRIAEEIGLEAIPVRRFSLPSDYEPRLGDVLERTDGARFEILGWTWDKKGLELQGIDEPLTIYLRPDEIRDGFVTLVSRRGE